MAEVLKQLIPLVLSANTLALTWLVGNRKTSGWVLGCIGQALWFVFIFTWQVWGLLLLAIGLTIVYARNLLRWRREQRADNTEFVAAEVPCNACDDQSRVAADGCVYLDASGPGEPKVIHGEDRILEAMTRAWEGRGQVYAINLRAMAASLHKDGHPHDADHSDLCQHESAVRDGGESHG